jgi:hypothetical protein
MKVRKGKAFLKKADTAERSEKKINFILDKALLIIKISIYEQ